MSKSPTIREVAERAGVSIATVSRVVNNRGPISRDAKDAVNKAIREAGFRPNIVGRNLKTAKTHTIGVLVPSLKNPIFADAVQGIETAADAAGYRILLASSNYRPDKEVRALNLLLCNRVDGLVLTVADESSSQAMDLLQRERVPYVLVFNPAKGVAHSVMTIDNCAAATEMVNQLIDLGHRRIAMIVGDFKASDRSKLRRAGYERAMKTRGLTPGPVIEVDFNSMNVDQHCKTLLASMEPPTAIFCSTDMLAISTIRAMTNAGLRVPDDMSVAGFDGITVGECISPTLATVVQPAEEMGAHALRHLLDRINSNAPPLKLTLPYRLRSGESWGMPRASACDEIDPGGDKRSTTI